MKRISRRTFGKLLVGVGTSVMVGATELRFMRSAEAALGQPTVSGTAAWGAQAPKEPITLLNNRPVGIIIHHTTNLNTNDFTQAAGHLRARQIQQSHFGRGWIDTGQHFTVSRGGWIMEGRHRSLEVLNGGSKHVRSAHADGYNDTHLGIECEGLYTSVAPTLPLWNNVVALCAYMCQQYGLSPNAIIGHRDVNNTSCPGDTFYALLPQLRSAVAATLAGQAVGRVWPTLRRSSPATSLVKSLQYFLRYHGATVTADGAFGAGTETAVKNFQTARGLTADGIVGAATWEALIVTVRQGDTNEAVKALQQQLVSQGYSTTIDGVFGSGTNTTVRSFQTNRALTVDGVVGLNTWNHLMM